MTDPVPYRATRNPRLLFRFVGLLLLRFAARQLIALLFQLPPRFTRFEPFGCHPKFLQPRQHSL